MGILPVLLREDLGVLLESVDPGKPGSTDLLAILASSRQNHTPDKPARRESDPSAPQRRAHRFGWIGAIRQRP